VGHRFFALSGSRVNDKKVNEGNSKNKKVKTERKTRAAGDMYPTPCLCWIQQ
jgi:hypothetical protein